MVFIDIDFEQIIGDDVAQQLIKLHIRNDCLQSLWWIYFWKTDIRWIQFLIVPSVGPWFHLLSQEIICMCSVFPPPPGMSAADRRTQWRAIRMEGFGQNPYFLLHVCWCRTFQATYTTTHASCNDVVVVFRWKQISNNHFHAGFGPAHLSRPPRNANEFQRNWQPIKIDSIICHNPRLCLWNATTIFFFVNRLISLPKAQYASIQLKESRLGRLSSNAIAATHSDYFVEALINCY